MFDSLMSAQEARLLEDLRERVKSRFPWMTAREIEQKVREALKEPQRF